MIGVLSASEKIAQLKPLSDRILIKVRVCGVVVWSRVCDRETGEGGQHSGATQWVVQPGVGACEGKVSMLLCCYQESSSAASTRNGCDPIAGCGIPLHRLAPERNPPFSRLSVRLPNT